MDIKHLSYANKRALREKPSMLFRIFKNDYFKAITAAKLPRLPPVARWE